MSGRRSPWTGRRLPSSARSSVRWRRLGSAARSWSSPGPARPQPVPLAPRSGWPAESRSDPISVRLWLQERALARALLLLPHLVHQRPGIAHLAQVAELVGVDDGVDALDLTLGDVQHHRAEDRSVGIQVEGAGLTVDLRGLEREAGEDPAGLGPVAERA